MRSPWLIDYDPRILVTADRPAGDFDGSAKLLPPSRETAMKIASAR